MADVIDDTQSSSMGSDMSDEKRSRYEQLKSQEQSGELDDTGRAELNQLRSQFEKASQ